MLAYFVTGAFVGFLAGLLGIGGGMTLVPVLAAMFAAQQLAPDHTVHLALGTGMASIMFTSSASVRAHHHLGGVDWSLVRRMGPAMVTGTLLSTALSGWVPQRALALSFAVIVFAGATQILLGRKPAAGRTLPGTAALVAIGLAIGIVCGLVSAGGAFMTVPFMLFCGVTVTTAIGTAAAIGRRWRWSARSATSQRLAGRRPAAARLASSTGRRCSASSSAACSRRREVRAAHRRWRRHAASSPACSTCWRRRWRELLGAGCGGLQYPPQPLLRHHEPPSRHPGARPAAAPGGSAQGSRAVRRPHSTIASAMAKLKPAHRDRHGRTNRRGRRGASPPALQAVARPSRRAGRTGDAGVARGGRRRGAGCLLRIGGRTSAASSAAAARV
jgi:hypothetical protein